MTDKIAEFMVNLIANHPTAIVILLSLFVVATLVNSGIKGTWPYAEMPKWARFVLYFTMPLALNFWTIGKKVGLSEPNDVSASAVRAAVARQEEKTP